jgi:carbamoyltransferase
MSKKHTYVIGINAYDHDVSACLLRDGEVAYAINKERITREKNASGFYGSVVDYCLKAEGITLADVELVVRNCYVLPVDEIEVRMEYTDIPEFFEEQERAEAKANPIYLGKTIKVLTISHHLAHAYSAFAASPFESGAVMITDGVGSYATDVTEPYPSNDKPHPLARESESYYKFDGSRIETVKKVWMGPAKGFLADEFFNMPGLGALYSRVATYIFGDWNKCGEVMGLAPYGRPNGIKKLVWLKDNEIEIAEWDGLDKPYLPEGEQKWDGNPAMKHWEDLAWRIQEDTERVLIERAIWLRETTGAKCLTIAGGVGLNCVANGRLERETGFDKIWIQPAAGDDGIAIGCAYYGYLEVLKKPRTFVIKHAYFGAPYTDKDVRDTTDKRLVRFETVNIVSKDICADAAKVLADGNIIGWFQGGSEFGPRALGNRSIIADPRQPEIKDKLNSRVKFRQPFRPFAPIVLAERVGDIFEGSDGESPYMLIVRNVRPEWKDKIPGIVHVDGTARIQTVRRDSNERLYRLIKEFDALTGVPVLVNTSFNIRGEPMVETPQDAMDCFLNTGIDYLILHDMLISKSRLHRLFSPFIRAYSEMSTMVRTGLSADLTNRGS